MLFARCRTLFLRGLMVMPASAPPTRPLPMPLGFTLLLIAPAAEQSGQLRQFRIASALQASIAQMRIILEFHKPNDRVVEGELQFPLTDDQRVTGFAPDFNGELRDAALVPNDRGRQVVEEIACRGVNPVLLKQTAGNQLRPRIYPLPVGSSRRAQNGYRSRRAWPGATGWGESADLGYECWQLPCATGHAPA
ncbi:VIT domain-containing protein [Nocardiopsis yanglingensis]